jgi:hypothetical protein
VDDPRLFSFESRERLNRDGKGFPGASDGAKVVKTDGELLQGPSCHFFGIEPRHNLKTTRERDGSRDVTNERKMMPILEPSPWVKQRRAAAGHSRTLQEIDVFPHLTVTVIDKARTTVDSGSTSRSA